MRLRAYHAWRPSGSIMGQVGIASAISYTAKRQVLLSIRQFARVVKGVDLRSTGGNSAWVRTPQLTLRRCSANEVNQPHVRRGGLSERLVMYALAERHWYLSPIPHRRSRRPRAPSDRPLPVANNSSEVRPRIRAMASRVWGAAKRRRVNEYFHSLHLQRRGTRRPDLSASGAPRQMSRHWVQSQPRLLPFSL